MVQKTASNGIAAGHAPARAAAARQRARKTDSVDGAAPRRSTEITPRRATLAKAARQLKSPKVFVPLTIAVGLGIAAIARLAGRGNKSRALPRLAKEVSPRLNDAMHALAELGRELRARIR
ncbi:hypothetical protein [Tahibacter caeni]|uniref:hypothetical protein n=1 Tax=Tahibacter caeni TaxID=1453545 RepID=UPI0021486602|nr:hypothetical protein [Tahibacter caeni]